MASPITSLQGQLAIQLAVNQAYNTNTLLGAQGLTSPVGKGKTIQFTNQSSLPSGFILNDQVKIFTQTVTAGSNATLDLAAASANIIGDSAATFGRLSGVFIWLPLITEAPELSLTVQASTVVIGDSGGAITNDQLLWHNGATSESKLVPGQWIATGLSNSYLTVDGTHKNVYLVNSDGSNLATLIIGLIGRHN